VTGVSAWLSSTAGQPTAAGVGAAVGTGVGAAGPANAGPIQNAIDAATTALASGAVAGPALTGRTATDGKADSSKLDSAFGVDAGGAAATTADPTNPASATPGALPSAAQPTTTVAQVPATPASAVTTLPTALSNQIAQQVNRQLLGARALKDGSHRAVIRLSPEHLGDVTVTLSVHDGNVRMDLVAGPAAITALQADLHDLRDQMAQSGLQLDDVSLRQSGLPNTGAGSSSGREARQNSPGRSDRGTSGDGSAGIGAIQASSGPSRTATGDGRLDVLI
jgi:flagellar hook-length control protein FliK